MGSDVSALRFPTMGTETHLVVVGADGDLMTHLGSLLGRLERRWSRYLPDSEVGRLNAHAGQPVRVHASTLLLVDQAIEGWRLTGGAFDPTVPGAAESARDTAALDWLACAGRACSDIEVDHVDSIVRLPPGTAFDPGGIGRGLAADLVVEEALRAGAAGVCVDIGGDLRVEGRAPNGGSWTIAVEHPQRAAPVAVLDVAGGAVATSTTLRRRWTLDGRARHDLIDPRPRQPSDTDVDVMTIVAGEAWRAEVLAVAGLLRGSARAFDLLDQTAHGLAVTALGDVACSPGLGPYLRRPIAPAA
jgi:thiamine biosynthesis lipoprotein